jgi:hypothetical protein
MRRHEFVPRAAEKLTGAEREAGSEAEQVAVDWVGLEVAMVQVCRKQEREGKK